MRRGLAARVWITWIGARAKGRSAQHAGASHRNHAARDFCLACRRQSGGRIMCGDAECERIERHKPSEKAKVDEKLMVVCYELLEDLHVSEEEL